MCLALFLSRVQWNRSADTLRSAALRSEKRFTLHSTRSIPCCASSGNPNPSLGLHSLSPLPLSPHPRLPPHCHRPQRPGLWPDRLRVDSTARRDGCKNEMNYDLSVVPGSAGYPHTEGRLTSLDSYGWGFIPPPATVFFAVHILSPPFGFFWSS
jgi:hypothetical protein